MKKIMASLVKLISMIHLHRGIKFSSLLTLIGQVTT